MDMKTLRTYKWVATAVALASLTVTNVTAGQTTITPVPHLGGGANLMSVEALNNSGAVAGFSRDADNNERAFRFRTGVMTELGTLGGPNSGASAMNDSGFITGYALLPADENGFFPQHAFRYNGTNMIDLGVLPGGSFSDGQFINANGDVAGLADAGGFTRGFVYRNGTMTDIGSLGIGLSTIDDLNNNGHVVGYSLDDAFQAVAFFFDGTTMHGLGTLGGAVSRAWSINDSGVIVGEADNDDGVTRAFIYTNGVMSDLGTLGTGEFSWAININNAGYILGYSEFDSNRIDGAIRAFIIPPGGAMTDLGTLGGEVSVPIAMNSHGHVIGDAENDLGETVPFLYKNGTMVNINTLLPPDSGWVLLTAFHINDAGQISGYGFLNGQISYYILTPGDNVPPVADAGADQTVECGTATHLDGTGSSDEDNDAITFEWRNGATVLGTNAVLDVLLGRGTYTLTLKVTDPSGESDEDTVDVTVRDTIAPSVLCPGSGSVAVGPGCQAMVPDFASSAIATDACSSFLTRDQTPEPGTLVSVGTHTVTVSVTDEAGNTGTCTVTLTVIDNIAPAGDCPPAQSVNADSDCKAAVPDFTAALLATDNCTPANALVKTQSPAAGTRLPAGTHEITLTVTDAAGNSSMCSTLFTVVSSQPQPVVTCPAGVTAEAGADGEAAVPDFASAATVIESCFGASTRSQTPAAGTRLGLGVHTVTVQAVDPAGNVGTCTTTFTVVDRTAPVITSISVDPSLLTEDDTMVPVTVSVTATDNVDRAPVVRIKSIESNEPVTGRGDSTSPDWVVTGLLTAQVRSERMHVDARVYTITVCARDASGNVSEATTSVTILKKKPGNSGPGRKIAAASATATKKAKKK